jgi:hypothetical protein
MGFHTKQSRDVDQSLGIRVCGRLWLWLKLCDSLISANTQRGGLFRRLQQELHHLLGSINISSTTTDNL